MKMMKGMKEEWMGSCGCGMHLCSMCGWVFLIWGLLFLAAGLGYLQISGWVLLGLGLAAMGAMSVMKGMSH